MSNDFEVSEVGTATRISELERQNAKMVDLLSDVRLMFSYEDKIGTPEQGIRYRRQREEVENKVRAYLLTVDERKDNG